MFRNIGGEAQSSSSTARHVVTSAGLDSQESPWISLLSIVSRPVSFLQKYLPGRPRNQAPSNPGAGWLSESFKRSFVDEEREFLSQLDDIDPPPLTYLQCQHSRAGGRALYPGGALSWLSAGSLGDVGIQSAEEMDLNLCEPTQMGYFSSARTFLSHIRLGLVSSQEIKPTEGKDWLTDTARSSMKSGGGKRRTWWDSFWGDLSGAEESSVTGRPAKTNTIETTAVFVQSTAREWTLGENTGPTDHKEQPANNGGLQRTQNTERSTTDQHLSISDHMNRSGAAATCSEVAVLTPDQDNGYSSLEEEHVQMCHLESVKALREELTQQETIETGAAVMKEETSEEEEMTSGNKDKDETQEGEEETVPPTLQCQNKAIAFIMGCPYSEDDDSQSDGVSSNDDDDGFDSEGSSDLPDSSDNGEDDDDDSDSEVDSEAERLWTSMCQTTDPYNPQNFTASLQTSTSPPRTIPTSTSPSSVLSTPTSSPNLIPLPLSSLSAFPPLASSPPSGSDSWDDSASASETDEAESFRLWSSFSCSSDPYSPFNFQATIRTKGPTEALPLARARPRKTSHCSPQHIPTSPPEYRKEEAEERLDSGFSELCTSTSSKNKKQVRFCDDVEEFFASCSEGEEDRRGPWEEMARDRCRFLRRCQEVEQSIAYCLQPQHRGLVYSRLILLHLQDD